MLLLAGFVAGGVYLQNREQVLALETGAKQQAEEREQTERRLQKDADDARAEADRQYKRAETALYFNRVVRAHYQWRANEVARRPELRA